MWHAAAIAAVVGAAAGCADERRLADACPTWQAAVAPALAGCASCHGGAAPAAGYDLGGYLGALGPGTDGIANAIAGDPASALIVRVDPAVAGDAAHGGQGTLHGLLRRWVVECELGYLDSTIHPAGVLDPASPDFHGAELQARGWDLGLCAQCHGDDFAGGAAGASCTSCHTGGPDACDTCHEAVPTTGAHAAHVGTGAADVACAGCHRVPARWDDEGHIRRDDAGDPAPAEVELTGLATVTVKPADRAGPPVFAGGTCHNVYCHGAVLGAAGGTTPEPAWARDAPGPASCDSCHGAPPPRHASRDACAACHPPGLHLDGITQVGSGPGDCSGCHGSAGSPAPPRDLSGNLYTTALGVGAHQAHLQAPSGLSGPVACAACHQVPTSVTAPGHLDDDRPAEVEPTLGWDRTSATCATAWCHGDARPVWTATGEAACGTCHGVPPTSPPHAATMTLTACAACHPATMDGTGRILVGGAHLDGDVDAP